VRAILAGLALGWAAAVPALPGDQKQPIQIEADGVEIDDGRQVSIYTGDVEVRQGSMHMWAAKITVHHKQSRQPHRIVAEGRPVRFRQVVKKGEKEVKARANRMEYDANREEILLLGKAVLTQGKDSFSSDRILYDRNKGVVKAGASVSKKVGPEKRERVRITIDPVNKDK
jgi:lipopolysaccharide export system protein LptA